MNHSRFAIAATLVVDLGAVLSLLWLLSSKSASATAGGDFHIRPGSKAIDAGANAGVADDLDGEPRPVDGDRDGVAGADIGADEMVWRTVHLPLVVRGY